MKNVGAILVLVIAVLGCDLSKFTGSGNANAPSPPPATPEVKRPAASPRPETTPSSTLAPLVKKWEGKYPYEVKLLNNAELRSRLQKLMGRDFADLRSHFNVETPMEIDDGVFKAAACEAHNCGANNYYIYFDIAADNINVYHVDDSGTKTYFESSKIRLPPKFAADLVSNE